jgi:hypothetical protein
MLSLKDFEKKGLDKSSLQKISGGATSWTRGTQTGTDTIDYKTCKTSYSDGAPVSDDTNTCNV